MTMTMEEEIMTAVKKFGKHASADDLHDAAGRVHNRGSFNTALHTMKTKGTLKRFDLRNFGGKFVYGLPEWGMPPEFRIEATTPKAEPKALSQDELRSRLESRTADRQFDDAALVTRQDPDLKTSSNHGTEAGEDEPEGREEKTISVAVDRMPASAARPAPAPLALDNYHRFEIPIPGKRSAMFSLPRDLETEDIDMLMVMIEAFARRAFRKPAA